MSQENVSIDIIELLIRSAQNGYASEVNPFVGLNRETWGEEQLWDAIKDFVPCPQLGGRTRLMYQSKIGNLIRFKWLLKRGANINLIDKEGKNCFIWACIGGHLEMVQYLLETMKMNPNIKCKKEKSGFHYACEHGHLQIVEYLYDKCDSNETSLENYYPIHYAVRHLNIIKYLVKKMDEKKKGEETNTILDTLSDNGTILHKAVIYEIHDVIDYLIEQGVDINALNYANETALFLASEIGNIRIMEKLIEKGANPNIANITLMTPLLISICNNHMESIQLLLENGAEHFCDATNSSPLHWAVACGNIDIVKLLIKDGADLESKDFEDKTPLHISIENIEILKYLIDCGADKNTRDENDRTPLINSVIEGYLDSALLLIQSFCDD